MKLSGTHHLYLPNANPLGGLDGTGDGFTPESPDSTYVTGSGRKSTSSSITANGFADFQSGQFKPTQMLKNLKMKDGVDTYTRKACTATNMMAGLESEENIYTMSRSSSLK